VRKGKPHIAKECKKDIIPVDFGKTLELGNISQEKNQDEKK
jgi:hypothetical protein